MLDALGEGFSALKKCGPIEALAAMFYVVPLTIVLRTKKVRPH